MPIAAAGLGAAQKPKRGASAPTATDDQAELEPTKKKLKRTAAGHLLLTVGLTGARAGDTLEGCAEDTQVSPVLPVVIGPITVRAGARVANRPARPGGGLSVGTAEPLCSG